VPTGLYRVEEGENWYAFTQFEPLEARKAFPSFDEPVFKTPFKTTMRVPTGLVAATNGPETNKLTDGDFDVHTFAETRPLPTYLVAFAVGDMDIVEAPADAIPGVPFRILTAKGKGELAAYMLEQTPTILKKLTDYFGQDYPYQKLDCVAVPNFSAGAMENVGLVTFRETLLLLDPKTASTRDKRSAQSVMAHELAHMWFGNLVTLPWWDELWLNESFATWMASKVLAQVAPELESEVDRVRGTGWIVRSDSLVQSRSIRQPIKSGGDVYNAFDGITYGKGARVLGMFESWMGEEAFRAGVRTYTEENLHGTGTTEKLFSALEAAAKKPVGEKMRTFLDQPGAPLLSTTMSCAGGKATVAFEQTRYLPEGSEADTGTPWSIPVCVRFAKGEAGVHCGLVEGASSTMELPTDSCPAFFYPNANESGYFRWSMPADKLVQLATKHRGKLTTPEKVGLLSNAATLVSGEKLAIETHIKLVEAMSRETHRTIVALVIDALGGYEDAVPEGKEDAYRKWVRSLLQRHVDRVGYEPKDGEPVDVSLLRPRIISAMVRLGGDDALAKKARGTVDTFLKRMDSVPADMASLALPLAALEGDASLWLSYKMAIDSAPTPAARRAVLSGLGSFRRPKLVGKSLGLLLDGSVRSQDFWAIVGPTMDEPETFAVTWSWMTENFDAIVEFLGSKSVRSLPWVGGGYCSDEGAKTVEAFFNGRANEAVGVKRTLSQATERIRQCGRFRAYAAPGLESAL
jgi:alanyl aminopeptidase